MNRLKIFSSSFTKIKINVWLNYSFVLLAFVIPLSRSAISILVVISMFLWIVEGDWSRKYGLLKKDPMVMSIFIFLLWMFTSLLWTDNYPKAAYNIKNYLHLLLVPVMVTSLNPQKHYTVFRSFGAGMFILIVLAILNYFNVYHVVKGWGGQAHLFMHHLDFSMMLAWVCVIGIIALLNRYFEFKKKDYFFWGLLVLLAFFWTFVQTGRSGQVSLLLALPTVIILSIRKYRFALATLCLLFFMGLMSLMYFSSLKFRERANYTITELQRVIIGQNYRSSFGVRVLAYRVGVDLIRESPLIGCGIGDNMDEFSRRFSEISPTIQEPPEMTAVSLNHFHSQYFQVATESGLIGLFLWFGMFFNIRAKRRYSRIKNLFITAFFLVFFSGFIWEPFLHNQFSSVLIAVFLGWIYLLPDNISGDLIEQKTSFERRVGQ